MVEGGGNGRPLRIGFVSTSDPRDPDAISGMPFFMRRVLEERGHEIVTFEQPARRSLLRRVVNRVARPRPAEARTALQRIGDGPRAGAEAIRARLAVRDHQVTAGRISRRIASDRPDVLFGCCISTLLSHLDVAVPTVYFSDATARLINESYPRYRSRDRRYKERCHRLETTALGKVAYGAFASNWARRSAVEDYGLPEDRAFTVPMGAHVIPDDPQSGLRSIRPPERSSRLRLCIVAADPYRKRLDLAIDAVELLGRRGWDAELTYVGPPTPRSTASRRVVNAGRLRLSSPSDRRRYQRILHDTHLMILPSSAEAFGIAPCEAAHFARPSIVSGVGGLREVVEHERTGLVLPPDASAAAYADAVEQLVGNTEAYARSCRAAHRRSQATLSWDRWADRITELLHRAAGNGRRT